MRRGESLSQTAGESMGRGESLSQTAGESMSQTARRVPSVQEKKQPTRKEATDRKRNNRQNTSSHIE
jgi:hypothetical protein